MNYEIDSLGENKSVWLPCGKFPLKEISEGRRACRKGWRNRGRPEEEMDMLAVILCTSNDGNYLGLQRESAQNIEDTDMFSNVEDMLAVDWFLEEDPSTPEEIENSLIPEENIPAIIDALLESCFWLHSLKTNDAYRRLHDDHDGTENGRLTVCFSPDGDAWVWIDGVPSGKSLRFRMPDGGGNSFRTRVALLILARAIQLDEEKPVR